MKNVITDFSPPIGSDSGTAGACAVGRPVASGSAGRSGAPAQDIISNAATIGPNRNMANLLVRSRDPTKTDASVRSRTFGVVDNEHFAWTPRGIEPETEIVPQLRH